MRYAPLLACLLLASPGFAQITPLGLTFQAQTGANTTDSTGFVCNDPNGGFGFNASTSSCSDVQGETAASSAQTDATSDARGGDFSVVTQATATAVEAPGPFAAFGNAVSNTTALENWTLSADTFYSVALASASDSDGASSTANASATFSGGAGAPSGQLGPGTYALQAASSANAFATETGALTGAASASASARITFALVGSPTLVRGFVTAGGQAAPGLLVEAFDGAVLLDTTLTGDDGSYLLPEVSSSATLQFSDPSGAYQPVQSPLLAPPATFDADLPGVVPALPAPFAGILSLALVVAGSWWSNPRR